jgi:hypothetical protein
MAYVVLYIANRPVLCVCCQRPPVPPTIHAGSRLHSEGLVHDFACARRMPPCRAAAWILLDCMASSSYTCCCKLRMIHVRTAFLVTTIGEA